MGDYAHSDLTLHGRFTDDHQYFRLFVLLNGVEVPVQTLAVHDYREAFEEADKKGSEQQSSEQQQQ